jgi:hypothetical protein
MQSQLSKNNLAANNAYLRLTSAALQMSAVIGGFAWLGTYLDSKFNPDGSLWTVLLSLFGVGIGLYLIIKEVLSISKEDN